MGYLSRQPTSNDPPPSNEGKSPWLEENELVDEVCLLLNGLAKRCVVCKRATRIRHLDSKQRCPDCR
jgi:hypothetical protein